ncbi:MAG TPA: hypothetical protein VGE45_18790 [Chloroflexia bacterium]
MLEAEEVQSILRVYDHLETYIRNKFPELSENEIVEKLQQSMRSRPFRKYLEVKDEIDEALMKTNSNQQIKPWYER